MGLFTKQGSLHDVTSTMNHYSWISNVTLVGKGEEPIGRGRENKEMNLYQEWKWMRNVSGQGKGRSWMGLQTSLLIPVLVLWSQVFVALMDSFISVRTLMKNNPEFSAARVL